MGSLKFVKTSLEGGSPLDTLKTALWSAECCLALPLAPLEFVPASKLVQCTRRRRRRRRRKVCSKLTQDSERDRATYIHAYVHTYIHTYRYILYSMSSTCDGMFVHVHAWVGAFVGVCACVRLRVPAIVWIYADKKQVQHTTQPSSLPASSS